jgi:hypothetical protein
VRMNVLATILLLLCAASAQAGGALTCSDAFSAIPSWKEKVTATARSGASVREILASFPEDLLARRTFVWNSRSFQSSENGQMYPAASEMSPRLVMSNKDGTLLAAVSTHENQKRFSIEVISFDSATNQFKPFVIEAGDGETLVIENPISHFKESAPEKTCSRCHGSGGDFRPIWDNYPVWPGFIGSVDKTTSAEDKSAISSFLKGAKEDHPVFGLFKNADSYFSLSAAADNTKTIENDLQKLNAKRVLQNLVSSGSFDRIGVPLFLALASPKGFSKYIADESELESLWERIDIRTQKQNDQKLARRHRRPAPIKTYRAGDQQGAIAILQSSVETKKVARIAFVLKRFGLSLNSWSLAAEKNNVMWKAGALSMDAYLLRALIEKLSADYPQILEGRDLISDNFTSHLGDRHPIYSNDEFLKQLFTRYQERTGERFSERKP